MDTFRSLRHRNYRLYFIGQMISLTGTWMQTTALTWLAYELTHESKWPAFLMVAIIGPTLLLGAWAGALADRCHKHSVIVRTQIGFLASASVLTLLAWLNLMNIWLLLGVVLCHGVIQAIDLPSRLAFVPDLVERDDLINTVALNSAQFNLARAVGPAFAGVLLREVGVAMCFLLNAISYVAVLIALMMMRDYRERERGSKHEEGPSGFAIVRQKPFLLTVILLAGWVGVAGWPLLVLLPAFSRKVLETAVTGYSIMLSAVGVGALLAALTAATVGTVHRQYRMLIVGLVCVSVALFVLSQAEDIYLAAGSCGLFGYGMILFLATGQGVVQLGALDEHRGKVMGVWAMMLSAGVPVGLLVFGPAADAWGVTTIILAQGSMMAAGVLFFLWRTRFHGQTQAVLKA
jgi:predicted MFS family arabinose efflux permease